MLSTRRACPFLVGGAYAFARYTGIERHTKDFDVFVRPRDFDRALDAFAAGLEDRAHLPPLARQGATMASTSSTSSSAPATASPASTTRGSSTPSRTDVLERPASSCARPRR